MYANFLLRWSSYVLSAIMGGAAIFCLYYAAWLPNPDVVRVLLIDALIWGGAATAIVYYGGKYLER